MSTWRLIYKGFDAADESLREALCALGNGYQRRPGDWAELMARVKAALSEFAGAGLAPDG
jgi:hypothetical protein